MNLVNVVLYEYVRKNKKANINFLPKTEVDLFAMQIDSIHRGLSEAAGRVEIRVVF